MAYIPLRMDQMNLIIDYYNKGCPRKKIAPSASLWMGTSYIHYDHSRLYCPLPPDFWRYFV